METDRQKFEQAKRKVIGIDRQRLGIGTLSEKTVHAILKNYFEPDEDHQEIPIENFVADIYRDGEIIEIQTANFNKLRGKLEVFLKDYTVTVVYPIPKYKYLVWVDEESGELTKRRKSPKVGNFYSAFPELYKIKMYLNHPNIRFCFVMLSLDEYRLLNGWSKDKKKGSCRYDRIPTELLEVKYLEGVRDYVQFVPYNLEEPFSVKDFARAAKINNKLAGVVINILKHIGTIQSVGKSGNAILYEVVE